MGLTLLLCLALVTGFTGLVLESISIGTDYWASAEVKRSFEPYLFYNETENLRIASLLAENDDDEETPAIPTPKKLLKNKGFWRFCEYLDSTNENVTLLTGPVNDSIGPVSIRVTIQCKPVNFTGSEYEVPPPSEEVASHRNKIFCLDRAASGFACVCLGLQLCAVLTSVQAAYTTLPVLFTDCGVMFLFGAFFQLVCMVLFMISMSVVAFERPRDLNDIPKDYTLDYSWSFYLGWGSFLFSLVTGIAYLLLSRAWETEEVWLKPMGKEKKGPKL